jgi:shikimate kinase
MAERTPLYRQIADVIVSTDGRKVRSVAEDILREAHFPRAVR